MSEQERTGYYLGRAVVVDLSDASRPGWVFGQLAGEKKPNWFWAPQVKKEAWGDVPLVAAWANLDGIA